MNLDLSVPKLQGWIILDKPSGITSNQALGAVKRFLKTKKAGHAGTLDPLACGVLAIALNEATKTVPFIMGTKKEYLFQVKWGEATDTDDSEGKVTKTSSTHPTDVQIESVLSQFLGEIQQIPPAYSALKIQGQRAYTLARQGKNVKLAPRTVTIDQLTYDGVEKMFRVICSKGTYVRSLARDLAVALGTYGHITFLRRTKVGTFCANRAISLEKLEKMGHKIVSSSAFVSIREGLADIPAITIEEGLEERVRHGNPVSAASPDCDIALGVRQNGEALALGSIQARFFKPKRVFNI
ncbi:MAG: tRNA pseudouridine(55) synthase TruB [bacterium]|nr:tRNA pseudouridine(55) synthase TruB [bacterium]